MHTFHDEILKFLKEKFDKIGVNILLWRDDARWHLKLMWKKYSIHVHHACNYRETPKQVAARLHSLAAATKWSISE
jgi:hypothetical protein